MIWRVFAIIGGDPFAFKRNKGVLNMYGKGGVVSVVSSTTITGVGAIALPNTAGNPLSHFLAYGAITIGVVALLSQLVVRVLRRVYSA